MSAVSITFDTLRYANQLKAAGVPEKQAEVMSKMQRETLEEAVELSSEKSNIARIEKRVEQLDHKADRADRKINKLTSDVRLLKWMIGFVISGISVLILKAFFPI